MLKNLYASIILTYRCNARCNMCNVYKYPSRPELEITTKEIEKLPPLKFANITGGEPFLRQDIAEIVQCLYKKTDRIVISTNGYFTDRIIKLCQRFPSLGIRISIEGLQVANDTIRGIKDGYQKGVNTLYALREMGLKDIGFGMTVQGINAKDLLPLYRLSCELGYEFATATLHNSHYFHKLDNNIEKTDKDLIIKEFEKLIKELLKSKSPKKWFRAYFNHGLINYLLGNKRFLPCNMGTNGFFVDPNGDILACNGMDEKISMGNIKETDFETIWQSKKAEEIRNIVKNCPKNCWMIGSAAPAMQKKLLIPILWVLKNKIFTYKNKLSVKKK